MNLIQERKGKYMRMKEIVAATADKANGLCLSTVNRLRQMAGRKREGSGELVIILLLIVVGVGLVALFKTQITSLLNTIFTKITSEVTNSLITEPSIR